MLILNTLIFGDKVGIIVNEISGAIKKMSNSFVFLYTYIFWGGNKCIYIQRSN